MTQTAQAWLREGERLDDLQREGLHIIQPVHGFRFGTDAVLLADFAHPRPGDRVCDLGTGTGIIPLLLYAREKRLSIDALELQPAMAEMSDRSVRMNGLEEIIHVRQGDLRCVRDLYPPARCSLVTCNPPYGKAGSALLNPEEAKRFARHETTCSLGDVIAAAAWLLRYRGRFCCVFPAARLMELWGLMQQKQLEVKRLRLVHSYRDRQAHLCLVEAFYQGRPGLVVQPPLIIYHRDGTYTEEMRTIYGLACQSAGAHPAADVEGH